MRHRGPLLDSAEKGQHVLGRTEDVKPSYSSGNQHGDRRTIRGNSQRRRMQGHLARRRRKRVPKFWPWANIFSSPNQRSVTKGALSTNSSMRPSQEFCAGFLGYFAIRAIGIVLVATFSMIYRTNENRPMRTLQQHKDRVLGHAPKFVGDEGAATPLPVKTTIFRGSGRFGAAIHLGTEFESTPLFLSTTRNVIRIPPRQQMNAVVADFGGLVVARKKSTHDIIEKEESLSQGGSHEEEVDVLHGDDGDLQDIHQTQDDSTREMQGNDNCRSVVEHHLHLVNCNEIHQLDRSQSALATGYRYISHGYYREVFSMKHFYPLRRGATEKDTGNGFSLEEEMVVIKQINFEDGVDIDAMEYTRMDAVIAERLASNPHIFDVYGLCGGSILSEYFHHGDIKKYIMPDKKGLVGKEGLNDEEDVQPRNSLTPLQKLVLALDMAEGLIQLHGYEGGLIIHNDMQPAQYLLNEDQTVLKLNDFNLAEFARWDDEKQEYCEYRNGRDGAIWRSPEEYKDEPRTEANDVWALGSIFYVILTGLRPLYQHFPQKMLDYRRQIVNGETGYIDPRYAERSKAEAALVRAIQKCFVYSADRRASIFELHRDLSIAANDILSEVGLTRKAVLQELGLLE